MKGSRKRDRLRQQAIQWRRREAHEAEHRLLRAAIEEMGKQFSVLRDSIGVGVHEIVRAALESWRSGGEKSKEDLTMHLRLVALHQEVKRIDTRLNALHGRHAAELPQIPDEAVVVIMDRLLRIEEKSISLQREMDSVQRLATKILILQDEATHSASLAAFAKIDDLQERK